MRYVDDTPVRQLQVRYRRKKTEIHRAYRRNVIKQTFLMGLLVTLVYVIVYHVMPAMDNSVEMHKAVVEDVVTGRR